MRFFALFALLLVCLFAYSAAEEVGADEPTEQCACPRNLEPVCGSDAQTYPNRCEFQCAFKRLARQGRSIAIARDGQC